MIKFRVQPDGGEAYEVEALARDVLQWEKSGKRSFAQLQANQHMGDLYRIAHIASRRLGLFTDDLPTFENTCDLAEIEGNAENEPDPTQSAP